MSILRIWSLPSKRLIWPIAKALHFELVRTNEPEGWIIKNSFSQFLQTPTKFYGIGISGREKLETFSLEVERELTNKNK